MSEGFSVPVPAPCCDANLLHFSLTCLNTPVWTALTLTMPRALITFYTISGIVFSNTGLISPSPIAILILPFVWARNAEFSLWSSSHFLFWSCREKINSYFQDGVLNKLSVSFSRDESDGHGERCRYVQDLMRLHKQELADFVLKQEAAVYVCGWVE